MDPVVVLGAGLACVASAAAVIGVRAMVTAPREAVLERAQRMTSAPDPDATVITTRTRSVWAALLAPLGGIARSKEAEETSRMRKVLLHAGFRGAHALETFLGAKVALALALGGGLLMASSMLPKPVPGVRALAVVLLSVGFYAPNTWLRGRVQSRQTALVRSLADTVDLLVTCVEAGLGLDVALSRIAKEVELSAPELSFELRQTTMEIQAGVARANAFRRLAERTGVDELRALSAIVIQTEMFGTPIGRALRTHASSMRTRRSHRAEEKAATASVKMMLPLIVCILPSLFAIILGPAIVRIVTLLGPALKH
ncbi:type II secretion system F family protein [Pendulispora rubella]|uniref:Type II secretion system F family protein n=1 Tax=Pendulispora rubella TaxID=2741070 RepID=A0ABZ2KSM4_9BACT